jgi:phospholipase C
VREPRRGSDKLAGVRHLTLRPLVRALAAITASVLGAVLGACASNSSSPSPSLYETLPVQPPIHDQGIIKHVIIIVQENRSFDNLFNGFPGADTVSSGRTPTGTVALSVLPLEFGTDAGHGHHDFVSAYDGGKLDGFDAEGAYKIVNGVYTSVPEPLNFAYSYVPQSETQPYWNLATQFTIADRMFTSNSGPSFPAHQYLIAGQSDDVAEVPSGGPWGCDAPPGTLAKQLLPNGTENNGIYPCFDYDTLGDEMDRAGISWRYYAPGMGTNGFIFSAYQAVRHIRFGADWNADVISPETSIFTDISNNTLPQVSWVIPSFVNSDHVLSSSNTGPQWVASIVNAVGASPYWNDTAILITWDDWGGWYDHVVPPRLDLMGLGFRVPLLVVSPYARHGYVSHVDHELGSVLHFTEATFGLTPLSAPDGRADELADCFDFTQALTPLKPVFTRMHPDDFLRQPRTLDPPDPN